MMLAEFFEIGKFRVQRRIPAARGRFSFMALAGALQEAALADGQPKFVLEGGVTLDAIREVRSFVDQIATAR